MTTTQWLAAFAGLFVTMSVCILVLANRVLRIEAKLEKLRKLCVQYDEETEHSLNQLARRISKIDGEQTKNRNGIFD